LVCCTKKNLATLFCSKVLAAAAKRPFVFIGKKINLSKFFDRKLMEKSGLQKVGKPNHWIMKKKIHADVHCSFFRPAKPIS
jgi:hypothetical protein